MLGVLVCLGCHHQDDSSESDQALIVESSLWGDACGVVSVEATAESFLATIGPKELEVVNGRVRGVLTDLYPGQTTITVNAKDSSGTTVYAGETTIYVQNFGQSRVEVFLERDPVTCPFDTTTTPGVAGSDDHLAASIGSVAAIADRAVVSDAGIVTLVGDQKMFRYDVSEQNVIFEIAVSGSAVEVAASEDANTVYLGHTDGAIEVARVGDGLIPQPFHPALASGILRLVVDGDHLYTLTEDGWLGLLDGHSGATLDSIFWYGARGISIAPESQRIFIRRKLRFRYSDVIDGAFTELVDGAEYIGADVGDHSPLLLPGEAQLVTSAGRILSTSDLTTEGRFLNYESANYGSGYQFHGHTRLGSWLVLAEQVGAMSMLTVIDASTHVPVAAAYFEGELVELDSLNTDLILVTTDATTGTRIYQIPLENLTGP